MHKDMGYDEFFFSHTQVENGNGVGRRKKTHAKGKKGKRRAMASKQGWRTEQERRPAARETREPQAVSAQLTNDCCFVRSQFASSLSSNQLDWVRDRLCQRNGEPRLFRAGKCVAAFSLDYRWVGATAARRLSYLFFYYYYFLKKLSPINDEWKQICELIILFFYIIIIIIVILI